MSAKKPLSLLTACCFLFSSVFAPAAQAALDTAKSGAPLAALLDDVIIPPTIGRITQGRYYGGGKLVIAVQDLHCHPETQRNISEILALLDRRYRLQTVYVEGAYGQVDTSRLGAIGDAALRKEIVGTLLDEGRLTGAENYSITAGKPLLLKGIEDEGLHRANIVRLGRILDRKDYFKARLSLLDKDLAGMEAKYFNEKNKRLNGVIAAYRSGKIDGRKYYAALTKYVNDINRHPGRYNPVASVRMEDYPNLRAYMELVRMGESLRYKRVSGELQAFLRLLKEKLPYKEFSALQEKTGNFTRLDELYILLSKIADEYGSLEVRKSFPELSRFFAYLKKSRSVNPLALVEEEWRLVDAVRVGFSGDISELEVSFLADFYGVFGDYLLNTLSEDEYEYFAQRFGTFKRLWEKYAAVDRLKGMEEDFKLLDEYYSTNSARNERFLAHIAGLTAVPAGAVPVQGEGLERVLSALKVQEPGDVIVLVTGGFHTGGLAKLFEERKISYCTITPSVTRDTTMSAARYDELAKQQAKLLSQALALGLASQLSSPALCELAVRAAHRRLVEAGFTRNNLLQAAEELKKATGTDVTVTLDGPKASFAIAGGRTITLTKDADAVEMTLPATPAGRPDAGKILLEELLAAAGGTAQAASGVPGWAALVPESYTILRSLFAFAAEHRLIFGDGLLYELENNPRFADTIDGLPRELVADFPEPVQRMVAEHVRRETRASVAAQRSAWLGSLCAVDLLRDYLVAADADLEAPEAAPEEHRVENDQDDLRTLMGLSNLRRIISQQYNFNPNLHSVNQDILAAIVERTEAIFSGDVQVAGLALQQEYYELLAAIVNVVHSQAWLSPTSPESPVRERGILQGDDYHTGYERDELDPGIPEQYLVRFSEEERAEISDTEREALLYRNANSLLADLCSVLLKDRDPGEIAVSPRLGGELRETLYLTLRRAGDAAENGEASAYFIDADEIGRPGILPKDLAGRTVVICANRAIEVPPALRDSGASIFIVYSLEKQVPGVSLPIAFVTNYTTLSDDNSRVFTQLKSFRERGGNIDSYTAWYLALYYDETDPKHLDISDTPYYYDAIGPGLVDEQARDMGDRYEALLALLGTVPAGTELDRTIIRTLESRIRANTAAVRQAPPRGPPADTDARRRALAEYRTILKHIAYLQWHSAIRSGRAAERHAALERKLEQQYNGLMKPMYDAAGAELLRSSLLASSGMGAVKTALAFVSRADGNGKPQQKLLVGNNVYYEADTMVRKDISGQRVGVQRVRERDTAAIVAAVATGEYRALVLDPVSNAMEAPDTEDFAGSVTEDIPVTDLQAILHALVTLKYEEPFYVIIDASLSGPSFQITDYLNRADLPGNFHIIVYSSLQKLYQDGRELTAGGVLTLLSADGQAHRHAFDLLAETRSSLGMAPSLLSCLLLDALSLDNAQLASRTSRMLANAQTLAESLDAVVRRYGARDAVIHPGLPSHPDHETWIRNGRPGMPFVMLRLEKTSDFFMFADTLAEKLAAAGVPIQERDSYGFSSLTQIFYHPYTDKMAMRVSLPPFGDREMAAVTRAFEETYAALRGKGAPLTLGSSYALGRKIFGLFGWNPRDAAGRRKQDRITEIFLAPFVFIWDLPVHTVLLFTRKGGLSRERVPLFGSRRLALPQVRVGRAGAAVSWAAAAAAWFTVSHFLPGGIAGAVAACGAVSVVHSLYNLAFGSGTAANAPLTLPGEDAKTRRARELSWKTSKTKDIVSEIRAARSAEEIASLRDILVEAARLNGRSAKEICWYLVDPLKSRELRQPLKDAIIAIGAERPAAVIEAFVEKLQSRGIADFTYLSWYLGDDSVVGSAVHEAFFEALKDNRREMGPVIGALGAGDPATVNGAKEILLRICDQGAKYCDFSGPMVAALKDRNPAKADAAENILIEMVYTDPQLEGAIRACVDDRDPQVERYGREILRAVYLLKGFEKPETNEDLGLLAFLAANQGAVLRKEALECLGENGGKKAVPFLLGQANRIDDPDPGVRKALAEAMGAVDDAAFIDPVRYLAENDPDATVRETAEKVLAQLTEPRAVPEKETPAVAQTREPKVVQTAAARDPEEEQQFSRFEQIIDGLLRLEDELANLEGRPGKSAQVRREKVADKVRAQRALLVMGAGADGSLIQRYVESRRKDAQPLNRQERRRLEVAEQIREEALKSGAAEEERERLARQEEEERLARERQEAENARVSLQEKIGRLAELVAVRPETQPQGGKQAKKNAGTQKALPHPEQERIDALLAELGDLFVQRPVLYLETREAYKENGKVYRQLAAAALANAARVEGDETCRAFAGELFARDPGVFQRLYREKDTLARNPALRASVFKLLMRTGASDPEMLSDYLKVEKDFAAAQLADDRAFEGFLLSGSLLLHALPQDRPGNFYAKQLLPLCAAGGEAVMRDPSKLKRVAEDIAAGDPFSFYLFDHLMQNGSDLFTAATDRESGETAERIAATFVQAFERFGELDVPRDVKAPAARKFNERLGEFLAAYYDRAAERRATAGGGADVFARALARSLDGQGLLGESVFRIENEFNAFTGYDERRLLDTLADARATSRERLALSYHLSLVWTQGLTKGTMEISQIVRTIEARAGETSDPEVKGALYLALKNTGASRHERAKTDAFTAAMEATMARVIGENGIDEQALAEMLMLLPAVPESLDNWRILTLYGDLFDLFTDLDFLPPAPEGAAVPKEEARETFLSVLAGVSQSSLFRDIPRENGFIGDFRWAAERSSAERRNIAEAVLRPALRKDLSGTGKRMKPGELAEHYASEMPFLRKKYGGAGTDAAVREGGNFPSFPGRHLILPRNVPLVMQWKQQGRPDWWIAMKVAFSLERGYAFFHPFAFYREHGESSPGRRAGMILMAAASYAPIVVGALVVPLFLFTGFDIVGLAAGAVAGASLGYGLGGAVQWVWDMIELGKRGSGALPAPERMSPIPDAERNRLKRVLELDGASGDHLFVDDEDGKTDRLEVIDVSKAGAADREKLIASLHRWLEHLGPKKAVFGATIQSTLQALEDGPRPDRMVIVNTVLAVSRGADNEIRDVEALGVYGSGSKGTQVIFFEAAPWNRDRHRRFKGAGSQLLAWIYTHGGSNHLSFTTPFQDLQDLFKRYARGEYPWKAGWQLREDVLETLIKDQEQRAAAAKQRTRQGVSPEARITLFDESARKDVDAAVSGDGSGMPQAGGLRAVGDAVKARVTGFLGRFGSAGGSRHAIVCYRFAEDGVAGKTVPPVMTAGGQIFVTVILGDGVGRSNTGMKVEVDGRMRPVRADVSGGKLTLRVEGMNGRNKDAVISRISAMLSGTGTIGGSARVVRRMKQLLGRASDASLKNTDFAAQPVRIDGTQEKVSYGNDGSLVVPAALFDAAADAKQAVALLGGLIAVRNAESFAAAQNIFVYMDAEMNIEHFKKELKAFHAAGGTQMIIPESVFVGMNENTLREIAHLALRAGVRIYINAVSDRFTNPGTGFSGYAKVAAGKVHDFALGELSGTLISGYTDVDGLRKAFYASGSGAKILKFSELQSMKNGEGRLLWAEAITVLRTNALSLFAPKAVTKEYVRDVAYGLDWDKIPQAADLEALLAASRGGKLGDARLQGSAVGRYLDKLGGDAADETEAGALRSAFLEAVAERVLVKAQLDPRKFSNGLADTALEQIFGRKLLQRKLSAAGAQEARRDVLARFNEMIRNGATAAGVAAALEAEVAALAQEQDNAQAIDTIIELIGQLGEPKLLPGEQVEITPFDESSVNAILSAA